MKTRRPRPPADEARREAFLGDLRQQHGDWEDARLHWTRVRALAVERGDRRLGAEADSRLGAILDQLGDAAGARRRLRAAAETFASLGDANLQAVCLNRLGLLSRRHGRVAEAADAFARALELFRATGSARGIVAALGNLAGTYQAAGDLEAAADSYQQALAAGAAAAVDHPHPDGQDNPHATTSLRATLALNLGALQHARGDVAAALARYAPAAEGSTRCRRERPRTRLPGAALAHRAAWRASRGVSGNRAGRGA